MPIRVSAAPTSADDRYTLSETAAVGTLVFNVRANDGKNSGKTFYSLDDGQSADLGTVDPIGDPYASSDRSALGASIWINANGTVSYSTVPIRAQIDALAPGQTLEDSFVYALQTSHNAGQWSTVRIIVTGTNDVPVASADVSAVAEGSVISGNVGSNDRDVDNGAVLTFTLPQQSVPAGFSMAGNGAWVFDANHAVYQGLPAGEVQSVVVQYNVTDQYGASASTSLTITVTGTNDAPVAVPVYGSTAEDQKINGQFAATDADSGAVLSYSLIGEGPEGFTLTADGKWQFDAAGTSWQSMGVGETTTVSVPFKVSDGQGGTSSSVLTLLIAGSDDAASVSGITVLTLGEDDVYGSANILVSDPDSGEAGFADYSYAEGNFGFGWFGNVDGDPGAARWSYEVKDGPSVQALAEGETVTDSFTVLSAGGTPLTFTVVMTGVNDAPLAENSAASLDEDGLVTGQLLASDVDHSAVLSFAIAGDAPAGFELASDGSWTFGANHADYQALAAGDTQTLSIAYLATDEHGATSPATLALTVTGVNDRPVTTLRAAEVEEGQSAAGELFALDIDRGAVLSFALDGQAPAGFALAADGSWTFNASVSAYDYLAPGEQVILELPYTVSDEHGASASARLLLAVTGTNDGPMLSGQPAVLQEGSEDTSYVITADQLLTGWGDPDGDVLSVSGLTAAGATISSNADGSYTLAPAADWSGTLLLEYTVTDGTQSVSATQSLVIQPVNDPAVISGTRTGSVTEAALGNAGLPSGTGQLTIADRDSAAAFRALADQPSLSGFGSVTLTAAGSWTYSLNNAALATERLATGQTVTDSFWAVAVDGTQSLVTVTVRGANDFTAPTSNSSGWGDPNDFDDQVQGGWGYSTQVVFGTEAVDWIVTNDGADRIYLKGGNDTAFGWVGNDLIMGDGGDDILYGQRGADQLIGGEGNDTLYFGSNNDIGSGSAGNDTLYGGSGSDDFSGNEGDDVLIGGWGRDYTRGGAGADRFVYLDYRDTNDILEDFVFGLDLLDFSALDANSAAAGDQAFAWGGIDPLAYGMWITQVGNKTTFYADSDGDPTTAEFMVVLDGGVPVPPSEMLTSLFL